MSSSKFGSGVQRFIELLAIALFACVIFLGVRNLFDAQNARSNIKHPRQLTSIQSLPPTLIGNGVYYFPVTGVAYMRSLDEFYKRFKNQRCELQGFTEELSEQSDDSRTARTITTGFILHCREGAVEAQGVTVP